MKKNIFIILLFLLVSIIITEKQVQNDVFYTIKIGEDILKYGVDMIDHYSFLGNLAYTYPHWLYDVLIYIIYFINGFSAIYISTIILSTILLVILYKLNYNLSKNRGLSFFTVFFLSFTINVFITSRAQLLSYINLSILLFLINKLREKEERKYILYILIISLIIANTHLAMWPFIFILFLPFIVQDLISIIIKKKKIKLLTDYRIILEKPKFKITIIAFVLTILTGFLTPNFLVPFTYFIKTNQGISMNYISEHLPFTINNNYFLYIILLILVITFLNKKTSIYLKDLFMLIGLFLLTLLSRRSYALFIILGSFSFVRLFSNFNTEKINRVFELKKFKTLITLFMFFFSIITIFLNIKVDYINKKIYPVDASDYIIKNLDYKNIRLYNDYNYGSYLLFRGIPVFIDSRADLYLEEFNKNITIFKDNLDMAKDYKKIFPKYKITHVIIEEKSILNYFLKIDNDYKLLYKDEYFNVYERMIKDEEPSKFSKKGDKNSEHSSSNCYSWYGENFYNL